MGLVKEVFTKDQLDVLKGDRSIGHVRYSTAGGSGLGNAQPLVFKYRDGDLAVATNGNLVNAPEIRRELESAGSIFQTTSDTEVIAHLIARSPKGFVEAVSVRSVQLRHHNGPLQTIPFGEIKRVNNFSRDWVVMKLTFRVPFDTDTERVRKLINKLGREMAEDPTLGPQFMEPLKSQGVMEIDDFGLVMRIKFMTKPGEQFTLRRTVWQRIRELFEKEGIEFAGREVRVRGEEGLAGQALEVTSDEKKPEAA